MSLRIIFRMKLFRNAFKFKIIMQLYILCLSVPFEPTTIISVLYFIFNVPVLMLKNVKINIVLIEISLK